MSPAQLQHDAPLAHPGAQKAELKIVYDFSRFVDYIFSQGPTGIATVDMAYAEFLIRNPKHFAAGYHEKWWVKTLFSHRTLIRIVRLIRSHWNSSDRNSLRIGVSKWLKNENSSTRRFQTKSNSRVWLSRKAGSLFLQWPFHNLFQKIPRGAIYLNVSYANLKHPKSLDWLKRRSDILPVFLLHDLIPLERPNFFWDQHQDVFKAQLRQILDHASLIIVPTEHVRKGLLQAAGSFGMKKPTIKVIHFPPSPEFLEHRNDALQRNSVAPYFVVCGTIEPRKNHKFLLNIWKEIVSEGTSPPKLVVIGARGWRNADVIKCLETEPLLEGHILEVTSLPSKDLVEILAQAAGLLMPSYAEGYGLPVVEALSIGTPVIASDISVFREISHGKAKLIDLSDHMAWKNAILELAYDEGRQRQSRSLARSFAPLDWGQYFDQVVMEMQTLMETRLHELQVIKRN